MSRLSESAKQKIKMGGKIDARVRITVEGDDCALLQHTFLDFSTLPPLHNGDTITIEYPITLDSDS